MTEGLQRYQIMEALGAGTQGHTYRAIDRETGDTVAIKVVSLHGMEDWKTFDLFEREVAVLEGLEHPGIPRYRDRYASEDTGDFFLVMDLVEGTSLKQRLDDKRSLTPDEIGSVFEQALDILEYLHSLSPPVYHRDIKPANLILDPKGRLHLVDFGGVRVALRPEGGSTVFGTFGYMAPEQLHGEATPATDMYSLGATIAALVAGTDADKLPRDGLRVDLESVMPASELRSVVSAMLTPEPRDRLASVAQARRMLREGGVSAPAQRSESTDLEVAESARDLARTRAPFSVFVWLVTTILSVGLILMEAVILPVAYQILRGFQRSQEERKAFKQRFGEFQTAVRQQRHNMQHIAGATHPIRDERKALPRADDDQE